VARHILSRRAATLRAFCGFMVYFHSRVGLLMLSSSSSFPTLVPDPIVALPVSPGSSELLAEWLREYAQRDPSQPMDQWLAGLIERRAALAREQALREAIEVIDYIDESHVLHGDLKQHKQRGKSRSSWIARQVEDIARWSKASPEDVAALGAMLAGLPLPQRAPAELPGGPLRQPQWNDVTRINFGKLIESGHQATVAGGLLERGEPAALSEAASVLLKDYPAANTLVQDYIEGRLDPALRNGLQATLASATAMVARRGGFGVELMESVGRGEVIPGWFAHQTYLGTENARVLYDLGSGRIDPDDAIDRMADHATAASTKAMKVICKRVGGQLGEALAGMVPVVGTFLKPIGRKVGGWVGEKVAEFAGSKVGQAVRKGAQVVVRTAEKAVSLVSNFVSSAVNTVSGWVSSWC
jgi:hypothetical protein